MATRVAAALVFLLGARSAQADSATVEMSAACLADADSYRSNPDLGTLLHWADCLEDNGQIASAYLAFQDAVALATRLADARAVTAERRSAALRPKLSYITISIPPEHRVPSLAIDRDGFGVGSASWGVPVAADAGRHRVHVSAPGYRPVDLVFELNGDAAIANLEIPGLELDAAAVPLETPPAAPVLAPVEPVPAEQARAPAPLVTEPAPNGVLVNEPLHARPASEPPATPKKHQRIRARTLSGNEKVALVFGGISIVSVATSLYFFGKTRSTLDARDSVCPSGRNCQNGTNAWLSGLTDDAENERRAGLVILGVGGAAAALAVGLWTFTPKNPKQRAALGVSITPWGGSVQLGGEL